MESIEKHIEEDKKILQDPTTNPQMRRHIEGELHELEEYESTTRKKSRDHHDPVTWNFSAIRIHLNQNV